MEISGNPQEKLVPLPDGSLPDIRGFARQVKPSQAVFSPRGKQACGSVGAYLCMVFSFYPPTGCFHSWNSSSIQAASQ